MSEDPETSYDASVRLARATRALMDAVVRTAASDAERLAAAEQIERITAGLSASLHDTMPWPTADGMRRGVRPHSPVIGVANPFAPPLTITVCPDRSVEGRVTMQPIHEGPPGAVHGGLVATLLDQLLGHANAAADVGGMTAQLVVRYRRPTPYGVPLLVRARHDRVDGRKIYSSGEVVADGEVTAEAEGLFIRVSPGRLASAASR